MYGYVEKVDVSSGYGSMNSHTDLQHSGLESLMNDNDRIDKDMNDNLQNGYVNSVIGLLNSHTLPQDNESINLNDMNMSVENGNYCYMNSSIISESKNHNSIDYTNKRDEILTNM